MAASDGKHGWDKTTAGAEVIDWLYMIARRHARSRPLSSADRADVVQASMARIATPLVHSRLQLARNDNPPGVLEKMVERSVAEAYHRVRMAGLGGVPPNGKNWRKRFPTPIGGDVAKLLLENMPNPGVEPSDNVIDAAARISSWISENIGVILTSDAVDALVYILDRLRGGMSSATLVRGQYSSLRGDEAMRHLGFSRPEAGAFALWVLGRHDGKHHSPAVLAAASGLPFDVTDIEKWAQIALTTGFAVIGVPGARLAESIA